MHQHERQETGTFIHYAVCLYIRLFIQEQYCYTYNVAHEIYSSFVLFWFVLFILSGFIWFWMHMDILKGYFRVISLSLINHNYPYPSGLLYQHWGNHMIAPVLVKQPWRIWINCSKTQQSLHWLLTSWDATVYCICIVAYANLIEGGCWCIYTTQSITHGTFW